MPVLARAWQMLLKGLDDVRLAPSPVLAAEMVLVRLAYAAELPPPSDLVRELAAAEGTDPLETPARSDGGARASEAAIAPASFAATT